MTEIESTNLDINEQRQWLLQYKGEAGAGWNDLGKRIGIAGGTLSAFGVDKYAGDNERIATAIARFRQGLALQAEIEVEAPDIPEWFDTVTSGQIEKLLGWAQRGRIVLIACGPGTGKTKTIEHYRNSMPNVWVATMAPSTRGVNNMQMEILAALGERDAKGTPQALSRQIKERVRQSDGLIVIDEAQHLSEQAVEEIRSWHDATGIGIALIGNETVISRLEGGSRKAAYAQLYSRVSMRLVRNVPLPEDALALARAWHIHDPQMQAFVQRVARLPGGLRSCTMMMELATMIAAAEQSPRSLTHLQDAWAQLSLRPLAA
jgi:DNA transposition AAA+ family ATPase